MGGLPGQQTLGQAAHEQVQGPHLAVPDTWARPQATGRQPRGKVRKMKVKRMTFRHYFTDSFPPREAGE